MLTFKPAAGSYVHYDGYLDSNSGAYLISEYHPNSDIATIINITTYFATQIIVRFHNGQLNDRLTVIG